VEEDAVVVTAADEGFAGLLEGLLASLRRHGWPLGRVAVLDCGLGPASRVRLARLGVSLADPGFLLPDLPRASPPTGRSPPAPTCPGCCRATGPISGSTRTPGSRTGRPSP
jgi:hypothetical protein